MAAPQQRAACTALAADAAAQELKSPQLTPLARGDIHMPAGHLLLYKGNTMLLKI